MNATPMRLGIAVVLLAAALAPPVRAYPRFARATKTSCATCHVNPAGGPQLSDAGKGFKADSTKVPAKSVEGATYVSSRKCRACHANEHKSWLATPHAVSMDSLEAASAEAVAAMAQRLGVTVTGPAHQSKECLVCHTTGFGLEGGYPADGSTAGADSARTAAHAAVSCEACHGPGSKHVVAEMSKKKSMINGKVDEGTCRGCHTAATSPAFDFAAYRVRGVHALAQKTP